VDSLNYAYFHGELSNLQKQAVITLIEKKSVLNSFQNNKSPGNDGLLIEFYKTC